MELIDIEVERPALLFGDILPAHGNLVQLRDEQRSQEVGVLFADGTVREAAENYFPLVHRPAEIQPAAALRDHVADGLGSEERVEAGEDRRLRLAAQQRELTLPE